MSNSSHSGQHSEHDHHQAQHSEHEHHPHMHASQDAPPEQHPAGHQHTHHEHSGHHGGHGVMHEGHADMMRNRFFVVLPLTIIVVLFSPMIQQWFNISMPEFPGSNLIAPVLGTIIFIYGG